MRKTGGLSLGIGGVLLLVLGVGLAVSGFSVLRGKLPLVLGVLLACMGFTLLNWKRDRGELWAWLRVLAGTFASVLVAFVLASVLSSQEQHRLDEQERGALISAVTTEVREIKERLGQEATWTIQGPEPEDEISLPNLTYVSSEGLREAASSGHLNVKESLMVLKLANNIETYNLIVRFALDAGIAAIHEVATNEVELLKTVRENLVKGNALVVQQCDNVLEVLEAEATPTSTEEFQ